jgi:hypothetical protein
MLACSPRKRRDQQRALDREGEIDRGRGQARGPGADRKPCPARVLGLDGEQTPRDGLRISGRRSGEQLHREPLLEHRNAPAA